VHAHYREGTISSNWTRVCSPRSIAMVTAACKFSSCFRCSYSAAPSTISNLNPLLITQCLVPHIPELFAPSHIRSLVLRPHSTASLAPVTDHGPSFVRFVQASSAVALHSWQAYEMEMAPCRIKRYRYRHPPKSLGLLNTNTTFASLQCAPVTSYKQCPTPHLRTPTRLILLHIIAHLP